MVFVRTELREHGLSPPVGSSPGSAEQAFRQAFVLYASMAVAGLLERLMPCTTVDGNAVPNGRLAARLKAILQSYSKQVWPMSETRIYSSLPLCCG